MTTKTKNPKTPGRVPFYRRPITIIIAIILMIGIVIAVIFLLRAIHPVDSADSSETGDTTSTPRVDFDDPKNAENPPDKAIQYEGEDPNDLEELTGSITLRSISNGRLTVVASIDQYLTSNSTCRLILKSSSGAEVASTAPISVDTEATSSACGPLVTSVSQLAAGEYTIDVVVTSPDKSGHITTNINI